jgi:hypothetical protein
MKKLCIIFLFALLAGSAAIAQNADDALRYSRIFYTGTARFTSMGGAFTALGGDISSLSQNPAGLGVYRSSEISITPWLLHPKSSALFNNTKTEDFLYNFTLGQAGLVANIVKNESESGLVSLSFGYSFNKTNDLNQSIVISGKGSSSLLDHWADISKGNTKAMLATNDSIADAFIAWDTWLIDTLPGSSNTYGTVYSNNGRDLPSVYNQDIKRVITNTGYTAEHAISIGGNYSNKLYFGATLGITSLQYESKYEHSESTSATLPSAFSNFDYVLYRRSTGTGFCLKLGAIYKPIETLRIAVAFHSPTYFRINETFGDEISSHFTDGGHYSSSNPTLRYNYALTTPFRLLTGAAFQIGKFGLVSADYEFTDYGAAKFSETGDGFNYISKNQSIRSLLGPSNNLRLGAELRLNNIYFRGGYGYYGKSWKSDENVDLHYNSVSAGIGFREQNIFADFGFSTIMNSESYTLYTSKAGDAVSSLDLSKNMFVVTLGYKFGY